MRIREVVLVGLMTTASPVFAASALEMCTAAGNIFRDALLVESLRVAFNESVEWNDRALEQFPPTWKHIVATDIETFKPQVVAATASVLMNVPTWDKQGLNGKAKAREQIIKGMETTNEAYKTRCLNMLQ